MKCCSDFYIFPDILTKLEIFNMFQYFAMQVQILPENTHMGRSRLIESSFTQALKSVDLAPQGKVINPNSPWGGQQINSVPGDAQAPNVLSPLLGTDPRIPR